MAEETDPILDEFSVRQEVVAATIQNASNIDVAVEMKLQTVETGWLAHTLNIAAQEIHNNVSQ